MKYINIRSATFWVGLLAILLGLAQLLVPQDADAFMLLGQFGQVLAAFMQSPSSDPVSLILLGIGLITGREAIEKVRREIAQRPSLPNLDAWDVSGMPATRDMDRQGR